MTKAQKRDQRLHLSHEVKELMLFAQEQMGKEGIQRVLRETQTLAKRMNKKSTNPKMQLV
jgi:hypothetical protein